MALCAGMCPSGEFGFVLVSFTVANAAIPGPVADMLLMVTLSMLLTPALLVRYESSIRAARSTFEALGHPRAQAEQMTDAFGAFDRTTMIASAQTFIERDDPLAKNSTYAD